MTLRLALGTLRHRIGAFIGTFTAAVLAIALLAGGGLLLFSVLTAQAPANRFAATDVVVSGARQVSVTTTEQDDGETTTETESESLTGAGTLPRDLAGRLAQVPGVARAVPDSAFDLVLIGPNGTPVRATDDAPVVGHGWGSAPLTPFVLRSGRTPGPGQAVIDADVARRGGLSVGDRVRVTSRTGNHPLTVVGVVTPPGRPGLPAQGALFVADSAVPAVSGLTGPTAIGVRSAAGTTTETVRDGVRAVAADAEVHTGGDRVEGDLPGARPDYVGPISVFGFTIGITGFAAAFVLTGTVSTSVRQRLRELALLRTAGATPRQLRRLLGVEAALVALAAAAVAMPLGAVVARVIAHRFQEIGAVPRQFEVQINPAVMAAAGLLGVLLTFVSARIAGRRAVKVAPVQALADTAVVPTGAVVLRTLIAMVTFGGAIAVLTFVPLGGDLGMGMTFIASALLVCGVAAIGPLLVHALTVALSRVAGPGVTGWLARLSTRAESRRVAGVAVPLVLMFAINAPMLLNAHLLTEITQTQTAERGTPASAQLTSRDGLPLATVADLAYRPGVAAIAATIPTQVVLPTGDEPEDYPAQGVARDERSGPPAIDLGFSSGRLGAAGTFAASDSLADARGWKVGRSVDMWLADGRSVQLRLSGIYHRSRGFGDLALPGALVAAHDPRGLATTVSIRATDDAMAAVLTQHPDLKATSASVAARSADAQTQQGAWELMMAITLEFTAIAVVNTFAITASGRRREYADLRLAGATVGQLRRMAVREAVVTVCVALALGAVVTSVVVGPFSVAQDGVLRVFVDPLLYAGLAGGVAAIGLVAGWLPAQVMLRRRALPAIDSPQ